MEFTKTNRKTVSEFGTHMCVFILIAINLLLGYKSIMKGIEYCLSSVPFLFLK